MLGWRPNWPPRPRGPEEYASICKRPADSPPAVELVELFQAKAGAD